MYTLRVMGDAEGEMIEDKNLSFRLKGDLALRWWKIYDEASQRAVVRKKKIDDSKVARALMGVVDKGYEWLLTESDRLYFQTGACIPVVKQTTDTQTPCLWCGKPSQGGICEDHRRDLLGDARLTQKQLNALPYGAMALNKQGTVYAFNSHEAKQAEVSKDKVVTKNFFTEVALCTDVQDFHGRFNTFLEGDKPSEDFNFTYEFKRGKRKKVVNVSISFVRVDENRALVITKKWEEQKARRSA